MTVLPRIERDAEFVGPRGKRTTLAAATDEQLVDIAKFASLILRGAVSERAIRGLGPMPSDEEHRQGQEDVSWHVHKSMQHKGRDGFNRRRRRRGK